jgi:uncharacterized protein (DUF58 family)
MQPMSTSPTVRAERANRMSIPARLLELLHYDFCPGANRWVYWLKRPLWVLLLAAAAALAIGALVSPFLLIFALALAGVCALGAVWPWLTMRGLSCQLEFERSRTREGKPIRVTLRIANRWPWPAWGLSLQTGFVHDRETAGSAREGMALACVPGWSQSEFHWEFIPASRGVYPLEPPLLETGFPFGFRQAGRVAEARRELIVWPATVDLHHLPEAAAADSVDDLLSEHRAGDFGDLLGTRSFREGDSLRRVHWSQTARHGRLIVCERQAGSVAAVRVLVDVSAEYYPGSDGAERLNGALRVAASLCESLQRQHAAVECQVGGEWIRIGGGPQGLRRLMDALARIGRQGVPDAEPIHPRQLAATDGVLHLVVTSQTRLAMQNGNNGNVRVIAVGLSNDPSNGAATSRGWLRVQPDELDQFPAQWRRVCRAN